MLGLLSAACTEPATAGATILHWPIEAERDLEVFTFTDPAAWRIADGALELFGKSDYAPPVRSPHNIAVLPPVVGDFVLEARLLQTGREYGHRDLCIFFGIESPSRYYYVHLASKADDHAHNVFLVADAPRTKIAIETTSGIEWGEGWHEIKVERVLHSGRIAVWFDDMSKPIMVAEDTTLARGGIGFGSFDDTGKFDDIRLTTTEIGEPVAISFR